MKKLLFSLIIFSGIWSSCASPAPEAESTETKTSPILIGEWRGFLTLNEKKGLILPFHFDVEFPNDSVRITIKNAEERLLVDEIKVTEDSVFIRMPFFDSEFRCAFNGDSLLQGVWINHNRDTLNVIPFNAIYGEPQRFDCPEFDDDLDFEGKWKCVFGPNDPDSAMAIGIFKKEGHKATGTFLTETGDYRYLEGCIFGKYMLLSAFDGSHAFVFHAEILEDGGIWGDFYSGIHFQQTWLGYRDDAFQLREASSLTYLKEGAGKFDFSFKNTAGNQVSFSDQKFQNKVTLVQIFGSWCPNCMDETYFLADFHKKYRERGLEVVGLAFEKTKDWEKAVKNVNRLVSRTGAEYDFLVTGLLPKEADAALPMLNHIMSFPTTLIIDKKGEVRKIMTGYYGPATGTNHTQFIEEITNLTESLLAE